MDSCDDCGTRLSGGICPNCQEELHIYETQILPDGPEMNLSNEFIEKVKEQKEDIKKK